MTVGIINYGMGNLGSLKNAFDFLNYKNEIVEDYKKIKNYDSLILPGVGAFPKAISILKKKNFLDEIKNHSIIKKKNFRHLPWNANFTFLL